MLSYHGNSARPKEVYIISQQNLMCFCKHMESMNTFILLFLNIGCSSEESFSLGENSCLSQCVSLHFNCTVLGVGYLTLQTFDILNNY